MNMCNCELINLEVEWFKSFQTCPLCHKAWGLTPTLSNHLLVYHIKAGSRTSFHNRTFSWFM